MNIQNKWQPKLRINEKYELGKLQIESKPMNKKKLNSQ